MSFDKFISPLIASQFPQFYLSEGPNFVAFVQAYYEWMEQSGLANNGNVIEKSRSLPEYMDIDKTLDDFVVFYKKKYINDLPESIIADKRFLVKHIIDLYRAKGTPRAYKLLFRILFNEDIDFYVPGNYLFKPSDGEWNIPQYIEVSDTPYFAQLVGKQIRGSRGSAMAVVDEYVETIVKDKVINVLKLSSLEGTLVYGEKILCDDVPEITIDTAPIIFGSLSYVSIDNGGADYQVGDLLNVVDGGINGKARVLKTRNENGKIKFTLVNGGFGFSRQADVIVSGGYGTGANFQVGDIVNVEVINLNTDIIDDYSGAQLEDQAAGVTINYTGITSGPFVPGERLSSSVNTVSLDVNRNVGAVLVNENLSNSALGITNLKVLLSEESLITCTGAGYNNANLVSGVTLISNTSSSVVTVNTVLPVQTITGNGIILTANSTVINIDQQYGRFYVGESISGNISGASATASVVKLNTDWQFPTITIPDDDNLDQKIAYSLTYIQKEIGTIAYLSAINPGIGYSEDPEVTIIEPLVYQLRIDDGEGGYKGFDATVTAKAGTANGIVTAVEVVNSGYGYAPNETVYLQSNTNPTAVTGKSVVINNGVGQGYWKDNKSFISDKMYIQDSDYYQKYSYEIVASRMMSTYEDFIRDLIHPSGLKMFGKFAIKDVQNGDVAELAQYSFTQS